MDINFNKIVSRQSYILTQHDVALYKTPAELDPCQSATSDVILRARPADTESARYISLPTPPVPHILVPLHLEATMTAPPRHRHAHVHALLQSRQDGIAVNQRVKRADF